MIYPEEKIEEIRHALDIVELVGDYVALKKAGARFLGLCPFHNERTPSFSVNPALGIYKCFGCGAAGDGYRFVMEMERISFPEAVRMLAERTGVVLPVDEEPDEQQSDVDAVYAALRFAALHFYRLLTNHPAGEPALAYLFGRGITVSTIKRFGLGYSAPDWDGLLQEARRHHFDPRNLFKAGLVISRKEGGGYYDRYRERLIFPIFSHVGKVIGFGGRLIEDADDQPKYINSPETIVYNKSRVLYGLSHARHAIRKAEEAILVEGYMDVLTLHQAGFENVVASSGTALTAEQVKMIGRYARRLLLLYDADSAGAAAAVRGIDLAIEQGMTVHAVALPGGQDPDSYIRENGRGAFEEYITRHREDFVGFKWALSEREGRHDTPDSHAEAMREIVSSIALSPDPLTREVYIRRASEVMQIPDIRLFEALELALKKRGERKRSGRPAGESREIPTPTYTVSQPVLAEPTIALQPLAEEKALVRLMIEQGKAMVEYILGNLALEEFTAGPSRDTVNAILHLYETGRLELARLIDGAFGEAVRLFSAEAIEERYEPSENWERKANIAVPRLNEKPYDVALAVMKNLRLDRLHEHRERIKQQIQTAAQEGKDVRGLQEEMMRLIEIEKQVVQGAYFSRNES